MPLVMFPSSFDLNIFYWWITYYIFFTIQYNIGFRNKRNAYINPFPSFNCNKKVIFNLSKNVQECFICRNVKINFKWNIDLFYYFLPPLTQKGHVKYYHHLVSVVVVCKLACSNTGAGGSHCQHATVVSCCIRGI